MSNLVVPQNSTGSAMHGLAIVPSDTVSLVNATLYIYVGVTGNLTVVFNGDTATTLLSNVPVGIYNLSISMVHATGTTATNLVALW